MKAIVLNDTHCGVRNSSDVFIEYQRAFYEDVLFPYMKDNNITHIYHLGDYVEHRKFINVKAFYHNKKHFLDHLVANNYTMDILIGNHDMPLKQTLDMNFMSVFMDHYDNINIIDKPTEKDGVLFVPWICNENHDEIMEAVVKSNAKMCAGHFEFAGFELHKGFEAPHGMSPSLFQKFMLVLSGHYHTRSQKGPIHYLGSQLEFTRADCDDPKYFHVLDTDAVTLTPVRNPLTIYKKLYYDDTVHDYSTFDITGCDLKFVDLVVVNKKDPAMFDMFVDRIQEDIETHELKIIERPDDTNVDGFDDISLDDTPKVIEKCIENLTTKLDKSSIRGKMIGYYNQAVNDGD